jgi:hypothetical protein
MEMIKEMKGFNWQSYIEARDYLDKDAADKMNIYKQCKVKDPARLVHLRLSKDNSSLLTAF